MELSRSQLQDLPRSPLRSQQSPADRRSHLAARAIRISGGPRQEHDQGTVPWRTGFLTQTFKAQTDGRYAAMVSDRELRALR